MSEVAQWLEGKSILITGASGYIGKCVLARILSLQPKVAKIYLLLRSKPGKSVQWRAQA